MTPDATRAIVLQVGDRFFTHYLNKRVQTAWSLAGAKLFLEGDAKINIAENILKEKGYTSIRRLVIVKDLIEF